MTIQELGSLGELVGALATVATLVYLATQIRQNTKAVRVSSHHSVTDSFNQINAIIGTNPSSARIFRLGLESPDSLDDDERFSFGYLMLAYMRVFETLYYQKGAGAVEEQLYASEQNSLKWAYSHPGARSWWQTNTISFSPEFRAEIDALIAEVSDAA